MNPMALPGRIRRHFSWRLAATFLLVGSVLAYLLHDRRADYDERHVVTTHDGLRLVYELGKGDGPFLVALAGGPGISHHGFHPYLGFLREAATVVYLDPRGRGRSEPAARYRVEDDVRDVEQLRRALNAERLDLLGASYGAHLALAYAAEHPHRVDRLLLVSPIVGRSAWQEHLVKLAEALSVAGVAIEGARLSDAGFRKRAFAVLESLYRCQAGRGRAWWSVFRPRHRIPWQNFNVYEQLVGRPFGALNGDLASSRLEERLATIQSPTLVLTGECDQVIPENHAAELAERLPHAGLVSFDRSGHSPFADEPRRFADRVKTFLQRNGGS